MEQQNNIYTEILQRLTKIEVKLDNIEQIKDDVDLLKTKIITLQNKDEQQQKEIGELKDNNKWLLRTVVGGFVTAGIGIIVCYVKLGMGL